MEFREIPNYDYLVINDKVSNAVQEIEVHPDCRRVPGGKPETDARPSLHLCDKDQTM